MTLAGKRVSPRRSALQKEDEPAPTGYKRGGRLLPAGSQEGMSPRRKGVRGEAHQVQPVIHRLKFHRISNDSPSSEGEDVLLRPSPSQDDPVKAGPGFEAEGFSTLQLRIPESISLPPTTQPEKDQGMEKEEASPRERGRPPKPSAGP